MRSGVAYPNYTGSFSLSGATADSDFPVSNLGDLESTRDTAKFSGPGEITVSLGSAKSVGLISLVQHNASEGATWQVVLKNGGTTVADSGVVDLPTSEIFPQTTPYCPAAAVTATTAIITLSDQDWIIGGVQAAGFWSFTDVAVPREIGVVANDTIVEHLGADHTTKLFSPRSFSGTREAVDFTTEQNTALDFLKHYEGRPFTWVWDADDPTTWANECFLARQPQPEPFGKLMRPQGRVSFRLVEHLG
jgi:hypothetical protein